MGVFWCSYHRRFETAPPIKRKHTTPEQWAEEFWKFKGSRNE